jgi:glycosyltransferase involved in cell wall biosynthesis
VRLAMKQRLEYTCGPSKAEAGAAPLANHVSLLHPVTRPMELVHQKWMEGSSSDTERILREPLVSVICFCKNHASTIKRCIDSVLNQSYRNIELIIQDGASTDGTLELLRAYQDPRIKLISESDSGPAEAFWKALNRCRGDIVGSCLSDEELLPEAIAHAVAGFQKEPTLGAVTFDGYVTDTNGRIVAEFNAGDFNFVDYLFGSYCPLWVASFFRRQALVEVGLGKSDWTIGCLEFEIWCRVAARQSVRHFPIRIAHYGVSPNQLSNKPEAFLEHFESRALVIRKMFSEEGFFGDNQVLMRGCLYNQLYLLYNHVLAYKLIEHAALLSRRMQEILDGMTYAERFRHLEYFPSSDAVADDLRMLKAVNNLWVRVALTIPARTRQRIPRRIKGALRTILSTAMWAPVGARRLLLLLLGHISRSPGASTPLPNIGRPATISPRLYEEVAQIYYARGQIDEALRLWDSATKGNDPIVDGLACQARLLSPSANNASLLGAQKEWAMRHASAGTLPPVSKRSLTKNGHRIRVGYYCAFLDSDAIRYQLLPFVQHRNRERFEAIGYSPSPASADITNGFDEMRITGAMSDKRFVEQVRSDQIDIFVELSGFSPHNRFAAMAMRCAPVQISYLNHTGTSAVPNVDYVLADGICVLPEEDQFYTERVHRLPGSFFCFDYGNADLPPEGAPPSLRNGYVTFCSFGSGGKINRQLIQMWSEILKRVPRSVLYIRNNQTSKADNRKFLQDQFSWYGVPPERLRILGGTDRHGILRSYGEADISLDTWPYCGGNTIAESIWQGVPVITLKGDRFSSRYGASLITATGCPELVAETPEHYVQIAQMLAGSPERMSEYRANLRTMAKVHGFSDSRLFAAKLEAAYVEMLQRSVPGG